MKKLLITSIALAVMLMSSTTGQAQGCGIPPLSPLPPLGCKRMVPVCQCDSTGRKCAYVFVCQK